jgi:LuxR family maltose regulon positive regulatory protein
MEAGRRITLVSAPAGFGKTFCVSEWVDGLDLPVSWLSLDAADDDPGRFFTYFVAALQNVDANIGGEIEGVLRAGQLPPAEIISTTLVNDILSLEDRFLVVLDDLQLIQDERILGVLEGLVGNSLPAMHLVLVSREDPPLPLARMRANNQLTELRAENLRFTPSEADQYLSEVLGLSLSQADSALLEQRTEGWIVGLHLAGLALQTQLASPERADPSAFISTLSGSHRFILNYLTEEVLNQQPHEIQQFLLQTSILERLNGDLCDAVTGRVDSHTVLEQLYNDNLFLIPLDEAGHWYRYHQLFADLLRDRQAILLADNTNELHRRASRWYAQQGVSKGGPFVSEAVEHALAGGDYAMAVELIEGHAMDMLMQWHLKTVEGWMKSIPIEWCAGSPRANLTFAWMYLMRGDHVQAAPYLERLGPMFSEPGVAATDPVLDARWLALQSMLLNAQGKPTESLRLAKQALEIVPQQDDQVRSMIYLGLASAYEQIEDYNQAVDSYQMIIRLGHAAGNSVVELLGIAGLALLALQHGQYHYAFEITSQGMERIERSGSLPPISTAVYGELAVIHLQWYQLDLAHDYFSRAIQVSKLSGYNDAEIYYGVILSRLYEIRGDLQAAYRELRKVLDLMEVLRPAAVEKEVIAQEVRIHLAMDDLAAAEQKLRDEGFLFSDIYTGSEDKAPQYGINYPEFASRQNIIRWGGVLYTSALRVLLYRAHVKKELDSIPTGIELADRLIDDALRYQYIPFAIETLLLRAQMKTIHGNDQASRQDYAHAVKLGEPERMIGIYLEGGPQVELALKDMLAQGQLDSIQDEYINSLLAAFPAPQPSAEAQPAGPLPPLTERELEVLCLMSEGLKYGEIADRLYISLNTVRSHVKAIYGKLGVNNRTKAIEQAHKLGIL